MEINSYLLRETIALTRTADGDIGTPAATVDIVSSARIRTDAVRDLTLPAPGDTRNGRAFVMINAGGVDWTAYGATVKPGDYVELYWDGGAWHQQASAGGESHDWYGAGTTTEPGSINDDIWTGGNVGIGGVNNPEAALHFDNAVSDAGGSADFGAPLGTATMNDGFDDFDEYKALMYQSGTPQASYGFGIESGSVVSNFGGGTTSNWFGLRSGGRPVFGFRGDGFIRSFDHYGSNDGANNGTPTSVHLWDANGWGRDRPITDGNPKPAQALWGGNWLWGGWTPVWTANVTAFDSGWATAFTATAPQLYAPYGTSNSMDMAINAHMGREIIYGRECRVRVLKGWRVLVNGAIFGTREFLDEYHDFRTNLGNETNIYYKQRHGDKSWNWTRPNILSGASIEIQHRRRVWVQGAQANAYARVISGYGREANLHFTPHRMIVM